MYWRHRLLGIKFLAYSDHKPLENLNVNTKYDDELRELLIHLSQFNFNVKYMPGKSNLEADCLSRNPVLESHEASSELKITNFIEKKKILANQELCVIEKNNNVTEKDKILYTKCRKKIIISDKFANELVRGRGSFQIWTFGDETDGVNDFFRI